MDTFLLLLVIAGNPQIVIPMDTANDCVNAAKSIQKVHDGMLWCDLGGCRGKEIQVTCWDPDPRVNKPIEIPVDKK